MALDPMVDLLFVLSFIWLCVWLRLNVETAERDLSGKRKYDAILESKMSHVTPSSFALIPSEHRRSWEGIHVSLMSEVLGKFCEDVRNITLDRYDNAFAVRFCNAMCAVFATEEERMLMGNNMLATYLEVPIDHLSGKILGWRNDAAIRAVCGDDNSNTVGAMHLLYKNELCGTETSPWTQALTSHLKLIFQTPFASRRSVCPALLVVIAGSHMGVCATVHAKGPCVDPVVPLLPLLVLKQDKEMMAQVARALKACKVCVAGLIDHYKALRHAAPTEVEVNQLIYPYPRQFRHGDVVVPFVYDDQIEDKLVFKAHISEQVEGFALGQEIIVKFTKSYCVEAHELCYEFHQSAPRLFSCQALFNGWTMLVMEALEGEDFEGGLPNHINERLRQVVSRMHDQGLVHGDLRAGNIKVVGDRVCIFDFDWSGRTGEQRYPNFMNHWSIVWPDGARDGEFLFPAHDIEWLRRLGVWK